MARSPTTARGAAARGSGGRFGSSLAAPNVFLWGIGGLALCLLIVFLVPNPTPIQAALLAVLVGLSGAAIASGISGILKLKTRALTASGPFAVFVLGFMAVFSAGAPDAFHFLSWLK